MRVLVERGSIDEGVLAEVVRSNPHVVVLDRVALERDVRGDDVVITRVGDLARLEARSKPVVAYGELRVSAFCATFKDVLVEDVRLAELAILYELAAAEGKHVQRSALHQRCWKATERPKLRSVDVTVHRLRRKLETSGVRILSERAVGYQLVLPTEPVRKRVLVVEDERLARSAYARLLGQFGVDVDFAETAKAGMLMVGSRDYVAYLIDLSMPGGSGDTVIPVIQKRTPLAPIMIVTGRNDNEAIALSGKYGVAYVEKPCPPEHLKSFVERACSADAK